MKMSSVAWYCRIIRIKTLVDLRMSLFFFWWVFQFSFVFHCIFPGLLPYIFIIEKKKSFLICVCTYIFLARGATSCPLQFVLWVFPSPLTGSLLV